MTKELTGNEIKSTLNENYHSLIDSVEADHIVLKNEKEKFQTTNSVRTTELTKR